MPIVSSQIVYNHDRGNGSLSVHEEHTDQTGKIHEHRYTCPLDYDVDLALANWPTTLDTELLESEKELVLSDSLMGVDPATMTFTHISDTDGVRVRMKAFLTGQTAAVLHMLTWVQSFSTADLLGLGFTTAERLQITTRRNSMNSVKALFELDISSILEDF